MHHQQLHIFEPSRASRTLEHDQGKGFESRYTHWDIIKRRPVSPGSTEISVWEILLQCTSNCHCQTWTESRSVELRYAWSHLQPLKSRLFKFVKFENDPGNLTKLLNPSSWAFEDRQSSRNFHKDFVTSCNLQNQPLWSSAVGQTPPGALPMLYDWRASWARRSTEETFEAAYTHSGAVPLS